MSRHGSAGGEKVKKDGQGLPCHAGLEMEIIFSDESFVVRYPARRVQETVRLTSENSIRFAQEISDVRFNQSSIYERPL